MDKLLWLLKSYTTCQKFALSKNNLYDENTMLVINKKYVIVLYINNKIKSIYVNLIYHNLDNMLNHYFIHNDYLHSFGYEDNCDFYELIDNFNYSFMIDLIETHYNILTNINNDNSKFYFVLNASNFAFLDYNPRDIINNHSNNYFLLQREIYVNCGLLQITLKLNIS